MQLTTFNSLTGTMQDIWSTAENIIQNKAHLNPQNEKVEMVNGLFEAVQLKKELEKEIQDLDRQLANTPNEALTAAANEAKKLIENLQEKTKEINTQLTIEDMKSHLSHQRFLEEYLGKNYVIPTIQELAFPDLKTFNINKVPERVLAVTKKMSEKEAAAGYTLYEKITSSLVFPDIPTNQEELNIAQLELSHAFTTLSATPDGPKVVIDKEKIKKHIELIEVIRTTPTDYILQNPLIFTYKVCNRWLEIFEDTSSNATTEVTEAPLS